MPRPETYYGFLDTIVGDADAIDQEKERLDANICEVSTRIRKRLTKETVPGLLWYLAMKELERVAPLVGIPLSDFAGHARFLRALCASVPFDSVEPRDDPKADELLKDCGDLWTTMFFREMIDDLRIVGSDSVCRRQQNIAALTSLLNAVQGELSYVEQVEERVERLFRPFSVGIIEPSLGISTDDVVRAFRVIRETIPTRLNASYELMQPAREAWEEWRKLSFAGASKEELDRFKYENPRNGEIGQKFVASIREINHILLFQADDFEHEIGDRASAFLNAFSFIPGEVNRDLRTPYDDDVVRRRPFAKIDDGKFVLLDVLYSSFAPPHRFLECFDTDKRIQRLNKQRDRTLEDEAVRLFSSVIDADTVLRSYYLPVGKKNDLAERDLLLLKNDCAFVIESKAHPLRPVKQRRDKLARISTDVKRSIQEGYEQASSVIHHLKNADGSASIFDSEGLQVSKLDISGIRHFIPIVFLDSYYGLIATDLNPWLVSDEEIGLPWVVDRNTFESIILKIDSFEKLKTFLLWRQTLHGIAMNEDEAVFAGFFVKHGPHGMPSGASHVQLDADYADVFEAEFFRRKGIDVEMPSENIGPPVFSSVSRDGDEITFKINDRVEDVINIKTGTRNQVTSHKSSVRRKGKIGRNDPCACGSGKKFKKCCLHM